MRVKAKKGIIEKLESGIDLHYSDIFTTDSEYNKALYRDLSRKYHPDLHPRDREKAAIFKVVNELYHLCEKAIANSQWGTRNEIIIPLDRGRLVIHSYIEQPFEMGKCYITRTAVFYIFDKSYKKFYDNFIAHTKLKKLPANMELTFGKVFPTRVDTYTGNQEELIAVVHKEQENIPLEWVIKSACKGEMPPRHFAWVTTRLLNLCCLLKVYYGLSHNGMELKNFFVNPATHDVFLYGGWQYAAPLNEPMIGTTKEIMDVMPIVVKSEKKGNILTDLESVKALGRKYGNKEFTDYFNSPSVNNPIEELRKWEDSLTNIFGPRRFIPFEVDTNLYYSGG